MFWKRVWFLFFSERVCVHVSEMINSQKCLKANLKDYNLVCVEKLRNKLLLKVLIFINQKKQFFKLFMKNRIFENWSHLWHLKGFLKFRSPLQFLQYSNFLKHFTQTRLLNIKNYKKIAHEKSTSPHISHLKIKSFHPKQLWNKMMNY